MVAAWSHSATSGPVKVAPDHHAGVLVHHEPRGAARVVAPVEARAGARLRRDVDRLGVEPGLLGGRERVADRGYLGVRERHARGARPVEDQARPARAEDGVRRDARLVLAHVREQRAPVDVADRVQPVRPRRAHPVVNLDRLAGLEPDRLDPELGRVGPAPDRHEQLVAGHGLARVELDDHLAALGPHRRRLAALADVHAALAQGLLDVVCGKRLLLREQAVGGLDQRDLRSEAAPGLRHLHADDAAAQDRQALGHLLGRGGLAIGPGLGLGQAVDRRHDGPAAGGDDDGLRADQRLVTHHDAPLAVETAGPAHDRRRRGR